MLRCVVGGCVIAQFVQAPEAPPVEETTALTAFESFLANAGILEFTALVVLALVGLRVIAGVLSMAGVISLSREDGLGREDWDLRD